MWADGFKQKYSYWLTASELTVDLCLTVLKLLLKNQFTRRENKWHFYFQNLIIALCSRQGECKNV